MDCFIKRKVYGRIPNPPLGRVITEGTSGDCPECYDTTIKKYKWFRETFGCIQEKCKNYYRRFNK